MKRFIAVFLSAFMIFGGGNFVFADNNIPEALEQTILSVKDRLDIPDEYSEFEYNINAYDETERYELIWSKVSDTAEEKEIYNDDGKIIVSVDTDGNIFSYSNWNNGTDKATIEDKKSKDECLKSAEEFLKKVIPDNYSEFKCEKDLSDNNRFVFRQYKGDIPVKFNRADIFVDNISLKVRNFSFENADYIKKDFENAEGIISEEDALAGISEKVSLEPEYIYNYNYNTKEKKVFIAYKVKDAFYNKAVSAKTGDLINCSMYDNTNYKMSLAENASDDREAEIGGAALSEKEIAKIEEARGLLGKEDAEKEAKKFIPEGTNLGEMQGAYLSKDMVDGKYTWYFRYLNGSIFYDVTNKELVRFYIYGDDTIVPLKPETRTEEEVVTEETEKADFEELLADRKAKAEEYIKKVAPGKFDSIGFDEESSGPDNIRFVRKVNGLSFKENVITVEFNSDGKINSYYCDWYYSVEFPDADNLIPAEDVIKKINEKAGFGLIYEIGEKAENLSLDYYKRYDVNKDEKNVVLAYSFIELSKCSDSIDAKTGKEINYDGTEFKENFDIPESYSDIKGHWCEKYVNALLNSGIYIKNNSSQTEFLPDNEITKNQFFEFYKDEFYGDDIRKALKDKEETITRREMCKIINMFFGYEDIAEKDVFKNPFKDIDDSDSALGAMVISDAFDIITADENGNFNPDKNITNAEAAKILYMLELLKGNRY